MFFVVMTVFVDPYRSLTESRLFALQQMLLLVLFVAGLLIRLCDDPDLCQTFGFDGPFAISTACVGWNLLMAVIVLALIAYKALEASNSPTLRLSSGKEPRLTLDADHRFHIFLSHIWVTGQDQAALIKRQLQHLLPEVRAFLEVADLLQVVDIEAYVQASASVLIFLSAGYFRSRNCLREVS